MASPEGQPGESPTNIKKESASASSPAISLSPSAVLATKRDPATNSPADPSDLGLSSPPMAAPQESAVTLPPKFPGIVLDSIKVAESLPESSPLSSVVKSDGSNSLPNALAISYQFSSGSARSSKESSGLDQPSSSSLTSSDWRLLGLTNNDNTASSIPSSLLAGSKSPTKRGSRNPSSVSAKRKAKWSAPAVYTSEKSPLRKADLRVRLFSCIHQQ